MFVHHAGFDELVGQACATAVVTVSTFFANRAWTFPVHGAPLTPPPTDAEVQSPAGTPEPPVAGSANRL